MIIGAAAAAILLLETVAYMRYAPIAAAGASKGLEAIWLSKVHALQSGSHDVQILFLGDSTVRAALDPDLFSRITGVRAANHALVGDFTTYGDYAILSAFLAHNSPPRAVLLWHTVDVWPRSVSEHLVAYARCDLPYGTVPFMRRDVVAPPDRFSWPIAPVEKSLRALVLCIPSYRYRNWIRQDFDFIPEDESALAISESGPALDRQIHALSSADLPVSPGTAYWLIQVRELCRKKKIQLLISRSPLHERVRAEPAAMARIEAQNKQIAEFLAHAPEIIDLMETNPVFRAGEGHDDKDHVGAPGRERLTRMYAEHIRRTYPELFRGESE